MFLSLVQRLFALVSLALLAVGGYFIWSWWRLHEILQPGEGDLVDTQDWRLWTGVAILALSLLGRLPIAMLLGRQEDDQERMQRPAGHEVETSTGARLHVDGVGPEDAPTL